MTFRFAWGVLAGAQSLSHIRTGAEMRCGSAIGASMRRCRSGWRRGWNTWDVHSVATQVLLPEGLAIHVGMKHNSTLNGDAFLGDALIGRLDKDAEKVTPGPHAWDGSVHAGGLTSGRGISGGWRARMMAMIW